MKKIILSSVIALSLVAPLASFAATATSTDNGDPMAVVQAWGLTGYQTPKVACYSGYFRLGDVCLDISGTRYFKLVNAPVIGIHLLGTVTGTFADYSFK